MVVELIAVFIFGAVSYSVVPCGQGWSLNSSYSGTYNCSAEPVISAKRICYWIFSVLVAVLALTIASSLFKLLTRKAAK
jgi:hypothetical protein